MEYLDELVKTLGKMGPEAFCIVACIAVGYVVRLIPAIPNKWIPAVCILVAPLIYPFMTSPGRVSPDSESPMVRIVMTGLILGVLAFILHDKVIAKLEDRVPFLKGLLARSDETKQFRRTPSGTAEEVKPNETKP